MIKTDKVVLEVLKSYFVATSEGMAHTLERAAYTTFVKENGDCATGIATPSGEFFSYPRHIGAVNLLGADLGPLISAFPDYEPGDIVISNDPYATGGLASHLPDVHLIKPIFVGDELLAFAWAFVHTSDVGGLVAASLTPRAYEIQQEGIRIPPQKLYSAGRLDKALADVFLANCRIPSQNWGDLNAMVAALKSGEKRLLDIVDKFGLETVRQGSQDVIEWTEARVRMIVEDIPDGNYRFVDYLDDDMNGMPIRLSVVVRVRGSEIELDFTDSDPQVNASLNIPAFGKSHPFLIHGLMSYVFSQDPEIPRTGGIARPFKTVRPKGSIVNPMFPAAVGVRYATVIRVYNMVLGALAQAVPDRVPASGSGQACLLVVSAPSLETGERQVAVLETMVGGGGGTNRNDGVAGNDCITGFLRNAPVETIETHVPAIVERRGLVPDSAGAGRHRGGWATRTDFRIVRPHSIITARGMERTRFQPWGIFGGHCAPNAYAVVNPGTAQERRLDHLDIIELGPGDVFSFVAPGGGGYGDPLERQADRVLTDVRAELLSLDSARMDYGVIIADGSVDAASTEALRSELRNERGAQLAAPDFGRVRVDYESIWTEEASDELIRILMSLPHGMRLFAKRKMRDAVGSALRPPLTASDVRLLADELQLLPQSEIAARV